MCVCVEGNIEQGVKEKRSYFFCYEKEANDMESKTVKPLVQIGNKFWSAAERLA